MLLRVSEGFRVRCLGRGGEMGRERCLGCGRCGGRGKGGLWGVVEE